MNILGIYSPALRNECSEGLSRLESLELSYQIRDSSFFSGLNETGIELLEDHTHFVVAMESGDVNSLWFIQVASYAIGSGKPLFLIASPGGIASELFPSVDILGYFRMEKEKFLFNEMIRISKDELAKSGIAFSAEAFCESVSEGELRAVELFLNAGFSPDAKNRNGVPAVSLAIRGGHRSIVSRLLDRNVDIDAISEDRGNTPLMDAAACGDVDLIRLLIEAGSDLNVKSKNGQTALILALGQQNEQAAVLLLESGADPNIKDNLGMTAVQYAKLFGKNEILARFNTAE